ncbi:hypothetical protein M8J75_002018 [Diaphorina citri]|nr:hypothetical protein M8J75_002018 [Diaphorina citri]
MATTSSGSKQTPPNRDEGSGDQKKTDGENDKGQIYDCNICLDTAKDAVISMCGHLFCWPCLHQWLETCPNRQTCPVCKAAIDKDKVIPVYGRGGSSKTDPRDKVPPRPQGQRTEPENSSRCMFDDAWNMSSDEYELDYGDDAGGETASVGSSTSDEEYTEPTGDISDDDLGDDLENHSDNGTDHSDDGTDDLEEESVEEESELSDEYFSDGNIVMEDISVDYDDMNSYDEDETSEDVSDTDSSSSL